MAFNLDGAVALELKGLVLTPDPEATYRAGVDTMLRGLTPGAGVANTGSNNVPVRKVVMLLRLGIGGMTLGDPRIRHVPSRRRVSRPGGTAAFRTHRLAVGARCAGA